LVTIAAIREQVNAQRGAVMAREQQTRSSIARWTATLTNVMILVALLSWISLNLLQSPEGLVVHPNRPCALVLKTRMFPGRILDEKDIHVRALKDSEMESYEILKDQLLPLDKGAVHFSVASCFVEADEPLVKGDIHAIRRPERNLAFLEGSRPVRLKLPRERVFGKLPLADELIDLYVTIKTELCSDTFECRESETVTGLLVLGARVATCSASAPDDTEPIDVVVQVNNYRAAVIGLAQAEGVLSIAASSPKSYDNRLVRNATKAEERRIWETDQGRAVTALDLEEIFDLTPVGKNRIPLDPRRLQLPQRVFRTFRKPD
jgi:hypothetical protein